MRITDLIKLNLSQHFTGDDFHFGRILQLNPTEGHIQHAAPLGQRRGESRWLGASGQIQALGKCLCVSNFNRDADSLSLRRSLLTHCFAGNCEQPKRNCLAKYSGC